MGLKDTHIIITILVCWPFAALLPLPLPLSSSFYLPFSSSSFFPNFRLAYACVCTNWERSEGEGERRGTKPLIFWIEMGRVKTPELQFDLSSIQKGNGKDEPAAVVVVADDDDAEDTRARQRYFQCALLRPLLAACLLPSRSLPHSLDPLPLASAGNTR